LCQDILKVSKERLLGLEGDRRVILDGVQTTEDEIEDTDGEQQLRVQLLDNRAEATAGQVQELEALLLGLGVVLGIPLVRGVVPNLPTPKTLVWDVPGLERRARIAPSCGDTYHWTIDLNCIGWKAR
jgi:hypothetical protein